MGLCSSKKPVIRALLLVFAGMAVLVLADMLVSSLADTANGPLYRSVLRFMIGTAALAFLIRTGCGKATGVTRLTTTGKRWWWIAFLPLSFFLLANLAGSTGRRFVSRRDRFSDGSPRMCRSDSSKNPCIEVCSSSSY